MKFLVFFLVACGSDDPLVGKWASTYTAASALPGGLSTLVFNGDGTATWVSELHWSMSSIISPSCSKKIDYAGTWTKNPTLVTLSLTGKRSTSGCKEPSANVAESTGTIASTFDYEIRGSKLRVTAPDLIEATQAFDKQ